ncbi:KAT8 regulatory NSL complex subunit 1-like protein isoform X2 [Pungitius pungitius]|uniref:KAT8 regulatory NSL complex subunit 1-like protein isoform X2 n=1 Tax=Pungitius pungitius TaxID=134920 RepID=UPI002E131A23
MAPALTKILKDGHGIHLSSPPDPESRMGSADDGDIQNMWLNLFRFPSLDPCPPAGLRDVPADPLLPPCPQAPSSQCEAVFIPSPATLLGLLSFSQSLLDSHQVACVFPGVPDMFLAPVPEHNSQGPCLLLGRHSAPQRGPDGGDVHRHSLAFTSVPPSCSHTKVAAVGRRPPPCLRPRSGGGSSDRPASRTELDAALQQQQQQQFCRQVGLHGRAQTLQMRLRGLLGEHALLHCNQQLEGLKSHLRPGGVPLGGSDSTLPGGPPHLPGGEPRLSWSEASTASCSFAELTEFSRSSEAILRGLQEALDSEATASSSEEEEEDEEEIHGANKASAVSCEGRWLQERAELCSRWSWLQLRLADLEGRIPALVELHKHIRSAKGGVVLAEAQPLTDGQIQQTLLREMAGLSCSAPDADAEHCSPTRLLHNIERQSAQLSQIVNSLMAPLCFSPLSKQPKRSGWKGDRAFEPAGSKRRRPATKRLSKNVSCVCARTRPLVTYHKPKLFPFYSCEPSGVEDSRKPASTIPSPPSSSSCPCCSSGDPSVLCSDPDCSSSRAPSSRTSSGSLSSDTRWPQHSRRLPAREVWSQRPLWFIRAQPTDGVHGFSSTPLHSRRTSKQHARRRKGRVLGLSPIRTDGSAQSQHSRADQRKRKRRHIPRPTEDEEDVLYRFCDPNTSDEAFEESYTQFSRKKTSQGFIRKRQGESVYNIDNIVIPMSLAKVEKLQYKDILTPSWREIDASSLITREAEEEEEQQQQQQQQQQEEEEEEEEEEDEQVEDLANEVFAQRHLHLEQREKLRWSWGKRKCCRLSKRSGSRLSGSWGAACTSGEESSAEMGCALLDSGEQQSSEEWLPQAPWEPRVFPLAVGEADALLSDKLDGAPLEWPQRGCASTSCPSPARSSGATLPPAGLSRSSTPSGS